MERVAAAKSKSWKIALWVEKVFGTPSHFVMQISPNVALFSGLHPAHLSALCAAAEAKRTNKSAQGRMRSGGSFVLRL